MSIVKQKISLKTKKREIVEWKESAVHDLLNSDSVSKEEVGQFRIAANKAAMKIRLLSNGNS